MNARVAREAPMTDDDRIARLQSDVQHIQSDVTEIKSDVKSLWGALDALRTEFLSFKAEVAKELGSFKAEMGKEFGSFKAEVAKEFGSVRTSIERAKLWMVVTGVGTILSVWGAALALARFLKP
jgi:hypothetical protein